jgi:hypothetical protein
VIGLIWLWIGTSDFYTYRGSSSEGAQLAASQEQLTFRKSVLIYYVSIEAHWIVTPFSAGKLIYLTASRRDDVLVVSRRLQTYDALNA